ncbi:MAG: Na+/H+ antiporter NhaC family protein [Planctomycetota bacterium]
MSGSVRPLLALAFAALLFVVPTGPTLDPAIATLETRSWLLDSDDGPLRTLGVEWVESERGQDVPPEFEIAPEELPPNAMSVEFLVSGSTEDFSDREAELGRALREFARANDLALDGRSLPLRLEVRVGQTGFRATVTDNRGEVLTDSEGAGVGLFELLKEKREGTTISAYYPDRWSLIPAVLAIVLAILTGKVIVSLFAGCLAGSFVYAGFVDGSSTIAHFGGDVVWGEVLNSRFQLEIIGFVIFLFMAIGVMSRSGGVLGMVAWVTKFAKGPVSTQLSTWVIGLLIFFDDYSNCIVTGTTMRPVADRNRIAREKLAYIVDSTAAPIAGISIFSTWVAYEISQFAPQLPEVTKSDGSPFSEGDGFTVFVQTLPFRFYCIFTIVMVLLTIVTRREFGPMLGAARRAFHEGKPSADDAQPMVSEGLTSLEPPKEAPHRGWNAFGPILFLVVTTVGLIFWFGTSGMSAEDARKPFFERMAAILSNGESQRALCWASAGAAVLAILLAVSQRILSVGQASSAALRSAKSLLFAIIILILAWSIGAICIDLGTAKFLTAAFGDSFSPWLLPAVMFALSSLVAFSTGTSYGTMAILLPNVVVLSHSMGAADETVGAVGLMLLTIGAVLEGSIFGDHCSPISDTTVLSSVATGSDHLHHVRTQAPYALTVMGVAMVGGYIPVALFGLDAWPISWLGCGLGLFLILRVFGRRPEDPVAQSNAD